MLTLETAGLGLASLLILVGTLFMFMCRHVWLDFFETSAFKKVEELQSEAVWPLLGALTSNFLFITGVCIFSMGMTSASLLLGVSAGLVALAGVSPFATMFVMMRFTKQSPIGIPFEHLSPPAPAVIVIVGSAALLVASSVLGCRDGSLEVGLPYFVLLALAVVVPNLISLRHRRSGWLNQPRPKKG